MMGDTQLSRDSQTLRTPGEVFTTFLKLGLTSFGGPIAHLGYFREELVAHSGVIRSGIPI